MDNFNYNPCFFPLIAIQRKYVSAISLSTEVIWIFFFFELKLGTDTEVKLPYYWEWWQGMKWNSITPGFMSVFPNHKF